MDTRLREYDGRPKGRSIGPRLRTTPLAGIDLFYQQMIVESGLQPLFELAGWYMLIILLMTMAVMGWAGYNRFRFRGIKERRRGIHVVELADIARQFEVDADKLIVWQGENDWRYITMNMERLSRLSIKQRASILPERS